MSDFDDQTPPGYRLKRLEEWRESTDGRLEKGAEAFAQTRSKMAWFAIGSVVAVIAAAIAIGRVLQRVDDTAEVQVKHELKLEEVSRDIAQTTVEQVRLRSTVERVEDGQARVETKLDQALQPQPKRKR